MVKRLLLSGVERDRTAPAVIKAVEPAFFVLANAADAHFAGPYVAVVRAETAVHRLLVRAVPEKGVFHDLTPLPVCIRVYLVWFLFYCVGARPNRAIGPLGGISP